MKQLLVILLTMNIFNLFGQEKLQSDQYWEFDQTKHFKPRLNKGDFFKLSGFDFGWFVLEPISKFVKDRVQEIEKGKSLSYGQKAIYYWWYVDAQVTNGGFVQFYYNGYGPYVPTIVKGLEYIGDKKMAELIRTADNIYQKNKKLMDKAKERDLFNSDLYEKLEDMSALDFEYYKLNKETMAKIEKYIRENPNEICLNEEGKEFDLKFTGECRTYYSENTIKEIFHLDNGIINGEFKSFYENGKLKEQIQYSKGLATGEKVEYYENCNTKYSIRKDTIKKHFEHLWYYENGNRKRLEHKQLDKDQRIGEFKEWYDNGQLEKTGSYDLDDRINGEWFEFYRDGSRKLEAEFKNGEFLVQSYWNEKGEQTLKDGTGLYVNKFTDWEGNSEYDELEYKNNKRHGQQKTFLNGILILYQEMENGLENGYTRNYYKNGKIKQETLFKEGREILSNKFPKFDNPKVEFKIYSRICEECYADIDDLTIPDNKPEILNKKEREMALKADVSQFEAYGDDHIMNYSYTARVDRFGNVSEIHFSSASNMWIAESIEESLRKLKYEIALKDNKPIECVYFVQHQFYLTE